MRRDDRHNNLSIYSEPFFYYRGLTLVELIMTIAIFSILVGFGVPLVTNMIAGNQIKTEASAMRNILSLARSEAIVRRTHITLCARKTGSDPECLPGASNEDWRTNGWLLYKDNATSGGANLTDESQAIKMHDGMSDNIALTITGDPDYIRFSPDGESSHNTTFRFCVAGASSERYAEEVVLSNGRVRNVSGEATGCQ